MGFNSAFIGLKVKSLSQDTSCVSSVIIGPQINPAVHSVLSALNDPRCVHDVTQLKAVKPSLVLVSVRG
jgi:hypothetical protein